MWLNLFAVYYADNNPPSPLIPCLPGCLSVGDYPLIPTPHTRDNVRASVLLLSNLSSRCQFFVKQIWKFYLFLQGTLLLLLPPTPNTESQVTLQGERKSKLNFLKLDYYSNRDYEWVCKKCFLQQNWIRKIVLLKDCWPLHSLPLSWGKSLLGVPKCKLVATLKGNLGIETENFLSYGPKRVRLLKNFSSNKLNPLQDACQH